MYNTFDFSDSTMGISHGASGDTAKIVNCIFGSSATDSVIFSHNTFKGFNGSKISAISFGPSSTSALTPIKLSIDQNTITNCWRGVLSVYKLSLPSDCYTSITRNNVYNAWGYGCYIYMPSYRTHAATAVVSGNFLDSCGTSVIISGVDTAMTSDVTISNNQIARTFLPGFQLYYVTDPLIFGNTFRNTAGYGAFTTRSITFDSVLVLLTKKDSLKLSNTGGTLVRVVPKLVGTDSAAFTFTPDTISINAGDSTNFFVTFNPTAIKAYAARIILQSTGKTDTVTLTGTGKVMTIAAVRKATVGSIVSFQGVITRANGSYIYLQDTTSGMVVNQPSGAYHDTLQSGLIAPGDRFLMSGKTSRFNNLMEISSRDLGGWLLVARGDTSAKPATVTLAQLKTGGEKYENMLVKVVQLQLVGNADTLFKAGKIYNVKDPSDTSKAVALWIPNAGDSEVDSTKISVTTQYRKGWTFTFNGVLGQFSSRDSTKGYQLTAISARDVHFDSLTTGVPEGPLGWEGAAPGVYSLSQNYPNPFNPSTTIAFALPKASTVELNVYTMLGQEVATLVHETMSAGSHTVSFNAGNLASGLYFYRITSGDFISVRKMMLVK